MLRYLGSAATVSVALAPLMAQIAFSRPLSPISQYPEVQNSNINVPLCYIQTTDGRTLNLQSLCSKNSPINNPANNPINNNSPNPTNNNSSEPALEGKFRRGSGSGYASDSM